MDDALTRGPAYLLDHFAAGDYCAPAPVVEHHAIAFDPELDDGIFSLHNLRR